MSGDVSALVNPEMLEWARKHSSLTVDAAAKKLSQKVEMIAMWESGDKQPTFKQLITISQTYKRPVALFYLEKPPKDFQVCAL